MTGRECQTALGSGLHCVGIIIGWGRSGVSFFNKKWLRLQHWLEALNTAYVGNSKDSLRAEARIWISCVQVQRFLPTLRSKKQFVCTGPKIPKIPKI